MSKKNKVRISCPNCSEEQSIIIWESLNATLDPEAKQDLFERRVNLFICIECDFELQLSAELLYHDMEKEFCVLYYPFEGIERAGLFSKFNKRGGLLGRSRGFVEEEGKAYDYMKDIHVVFDMDELIRYVTFRDKLSDSYKVMEDFSRRMFEPIKKDDED